MIVTIYLYIMIMHYDTVLDYLLMCLRCNSTNVITRPSLPKDMLYRPTHNTCGLSE